jgi:hypothetical protein
MIIGKPDAQDAISTLIGIIALRDVVGAPLSPKSE